MTENTGAPASDEAAELDLVDLRSDAVHRCAHTVVRSRLRWASSSARLGLHVGRELLERQFGIAEQLRLSAVEFCCLTNCSCACAVTSAVPALSRSSCEPALLLTSDDLRSTSRCFSVDAGVRRARSSAP